MDILPDSKASQLLLLAAFLFGAFSGVALTRFAASLRELDGRTGRLEHRIPDSLTSDPDRLFLAFRVALGFAGVVGKPRRWAITTVLLVAASALASTIAAVHW
jgi:hypothetical protein